MTKEQREDIFVKWAVYEPVRKKEIITEYFTNGGAYSQECWLNYLKEKLEIEEYWKAVGLM